jgi:hypothetical protein
VDFGLPVGLCVSEVEILMHKSRGMIEDPTIRRDKLQGRMQPMHQSSEQFDDFGKHFPT